MHGVAASISISQVSRYPFDLKNYSGRNSMRKFTLLSVIQLFVFLIFLLSCGGGGSDNSNTNGDNAGEVDIYLADSVKFNMIYVPGGMTSPAGINDDGTATVADTYWIGETEVTYELWQKVYEWAVNGTGGAAGEGQYLFENTGTQSGGSGGTNQHPVVGICWRDAMVWCNALTEWYNAQKGTGFECVYMYDSGSGAQIVRDSRSTNSTACDNIAESSTAKGFRLLSSAEWEIAARYRDGVLWTYGDHVSGDDSGACNNDGSILGGLGISSVFGDYAVYSGNSGSTTAAVKGKKANALGIYDMSGNVWEFCFDSDGGDRITRTGSYDKDISSLAIGNTFSSVATQTGGYMGFRFGRTQ